PPRRFACGGRAAARPPTRAAHPAGRSPPRAAAACATAGDEPALSGDPALTPPEAPHSIAVPRRPTLRLEEPRMPRRPLTVIVVAFLVLALALPAFAQKPIKLGVLTPLSPPGDAGAGQFIVRGAKMGAEDVNARGGILGGRKIELVIEDDSGTPEKGVAGLRKLATQDQVSAVMGQFHSSVALAAQDLAEQFKIPFFITAASARGITEKHLNYTFRM